jgi:hypothetical protein
MGVLLRDFLTHQIFGPNGLVNLSNFAFLLGFSVRDFLKLRSGVEISRPALRRPCPIIIPCRPCDPHRHHRTPA